MPTPTTTSHPLTLEKVFKVSGKPTFTFVTPREYTRLKISLRTPGRCIILEGPAGIGKTTLISKIIDEAKESYQILSAKKPNDVRTIRLLSLDRNFNKIVIDDFHNLDENIQKHVSGIMKVLADLEDEDRKIVIIGINECGRSLIDVAPDLNERVEHIKLRPASDNLIDELIKNGEEALNISITERAEIIRDSQGCFHLAQMLCRDYCIEAKVEEYSSERRNLSGIYHIVRETTLNSLENRFKYITKEFCLGPEQKIEGRAPYLQILHNIALNSSWTLDLQDLARSNTNIRQSITNILRGSLKKFYDSKKHFRTVLHLDSTAKTISIEDPKFMFFLKNIPWSNFSRGLGYRLSDISSKYDIALSFAGEDRNIALKIYDKLTESHMAVFYDYNEQAYIAGENVDDYLKPIYRSDSDFVLPIMSQYYPLKMWTQFETGEFRERFQEGRVIPLRIDRSNDPFLTDANKIGGLDIDTKKPIDPQIEYIVEILKEKVDNYNIARIEALSKATD